MRRNAIAASGDIGQRHGGDGMDDEKMMREALRLAQEADAAGEVPVGCVVALGERIVGTGRNRREEGKSALAHAEIEAIAEACRTLGGWRLWQCTLYVTLEPCPMCAGAIMNARIPRIVYGAKRYGQRLLRLRCRSVYAAMQPEAGDRLRRAGGGSVGAAVGLLPPAERKKEKE